MRARLPCLLFLGLFPIAVLGLRWASFLPSVIDWDESLYVLQAREWLRGNWPFSGVWDMHPPGAPALVAAAFLLGGESIAAVRALGAVAVAATGFALVALARSLGAPLLVGMAAAVLHAAHSLLLGGLATNTEILFAPLVVGALALAVSTGDAWRRLAAAGTLVGLALLVKPVAAPEGCLAFALLAWPALRERRWGHLGRMAGAYLALCLAPTLLVGVLYLLRGEAADWFGATVLAPLQYAAGRLAAGEALWRTALALLDLRWLLLLALPVLPALAAPEAMPRRVARFGALWLGVAALAVAGPGHFFPHYFLVLVPPLALLAALGLFLLVRWSSPARLRAALGAVLALVALDAVARDLQPRLERGFALGGPDTPRRMARFMLRELQPGDAIFVANYQPVVYFLTGAALPTRFPFPVHLTGSFSTLAGVDIDAELARVLHGRPRFVVLDRAEWFSMRPAATVRIAEALDAGYELAASFAETRGTVELWRRSGDRE